MRALDGWPVIESYPAPPDAPDAREQFSWVNWLNQGVIGADLKPDDAVDHVGALSQNEDSNFGILSPQRTGQYKSVLLVERQIKQDDIDSRLLDCPANPGIMADDRHSVVLAGQVVLNSGAYLQVITDQQNMWIITHYHSLLI